MFPDLTLEQLRPMLLEYATAVVMAVGHIVLVIMIAWLTLRAIRRGLRKLEEFLIRRDQGDDVGRQATEQRVRTLTGLLRTVATIGMWALVAVTVLTEVGVSVGPLLAGAGIAGLAIGFGAQNLVRDVISGFFMVLENQIRVGDVVEINGTGGLVEQLNLRTVTLRDLAGVVHIFPHGSVTTLANQTMQWSAYVIDLAVSYDQDTDVVIEVMKRVHSELMADAAFAPRIVAPIEVLGLDDFGDSAMTIRARLKTRPAQQWAVGREYRRRLKRALDQAGIALPFPQRTVHIAGSVNLPVLRATA